MKFKNYIFILVLIAGCSSTGPIVATSDINPEIDFSAYQSFSWISDQPYIPSGTLLADSGKQRIQDSIVSELQAKGYRFVADPEDADFVISYTVGSRRAVSVKSLPTRYQTDLVWGATYWGGGGYRTPRREAIDIGTSLEIREYVEGQLAIDIFDVKARQPAWHGYASAEITTKDRKNPQPIVQKAVAKILETFPSAS